MLLALALFAATAFAQTAVRDSAGRSAAALGRATLHPPPFYRSRAPSSPLPNSLRSPPAAPFPPRRAQGGSDGRKVAEGCVMRDEERRDSWDHVFMLNAYECESRGFCWAVHEMCVALLRAGRPAPTPPPPLLCAPLPLAFRFLHPISPSPAPPGPPAVRASPGATIKRARASSRPILAPPPPRAARSAPRRGSQSRKRFAWQRAAAGCRASPGSPGASTPRAAASKSPRRRPRPSSPWPRRRPCPRPSSSGPRCRRPGGCPAGWRVGGRAAPTLSCEGCPPPEAKLKHKTKAAVVIKGPAPPPPQKETLPSPPTPFSLSTSPPRRLTAGPPP
jgi:hypothetical protein